MTTLRLFGMVMDMTMLMWSWWIDLPCCCYCFCWYRTGYCQYKHNMLL